MKTNNKALFLARAAMIAALYVALTYLAAALGLSGQNAIQIRFSEALCILPYFTAAAVPGLTLGCLLANIFTSAHVLDILLGTFATLIGALGTRALRKWKYLTPLPPILANTVIVPFVLRYAYFTTDVGMWYLFLTVGIGEILSVGVLGLLLQFCLEKYRRPLFGK